MNIYMPELSDGRNLGVVFKAPSPELAVRNAYAWLKHQDEQTKIYFTGTETPYIVDAKQVKESLFGAMII